jgi:hypothetical protein
VNNNVKKTTEALGAAPTVRDAVVLYISDFCPAAHSQNQASGHCQKPQLDLATSAFLLLSQQNAQDYIDSQLDLEVELLPEDDSTPTGLLYTSGPNQSQTSAP